MPRKTLLCLTLIFSVFLCYAQKKTINVSGVVRDSSGETIPAVVVYEDGNPQNGCSTDINGNYSISVSPKASLVFSCLGFSELKEFVSGRAKIDVQLSPSALSIDAAEVVSVGYGSVARRDLTGSVAKVDMEQLTKSSNMSFDQAIAGRVAGVVVTSSDGQVGAESKIVIRGNNSLTQSSEPLYVVDGFPVESSMASSLNPADIQSVDVLKDASATAIYGARGSNGVIVITTKTGVEGKPVVNFSFSFSGSKIAKKVDLLDSYDFVRLYDEYIKQDNNPTATNMYLYGLDEEGHRIPNYYTLDDYRNVEAIDWQDQIYRTALTSNVYLSVSGGSKSAGNTYNVALGYLNQDGIIVGSNFSRFTMKASLQQRIGKKVTFTFSGNYSRSGTLGSAPSESPSNVNSVSSYLMYSVWGYRPCKPIYLGSSSDDFINSLVDTEIVNPDDQRFNPAVSVRNEYRNRTVDNINLNGAITWNIIQGLSLRVSGGYLFSNTQREVFDNEKTLTGWSGSAIGRGVNGGIYTTRVSG